MAIEFNDNIHVKINRPTDFRFGPFISIAQANATIPIAQRYHGLIFGVYTTPLSIATSDIIYYYYWNGLSNTDIKQLGGKPPVDGSYANQAAMIAAQATQTAQYIYYDGTSYWEYLGTTNGNISDYREINNSITNPITGTGASGQVSFWNGTSTQSGVSTFVYDSVNNRVGINRATPSATLDVNGNIFANNQFRFNNNTGSLTNNNGDQLLFFSESLTELRIVNPYASGFITFQSGSPVIEKMRLFSTGNLLLQNGGTFTDAGFKLQVNGSGYISGDLLIGTTNTATGQKVRISGGSLNITNWPTSSGAYDKLSINFGEDRGFGYDPNLNQIYVKGATNVPIKIFSEAPTDSLIVTLDGNTKIGGQIHTPIESKGNSGSGTVTFNWNDSNIQTVTLTGNCTFAFSNPQSGGSYQIVITQDGTGGRTITWPTIYWQNKTTPLLSNSANTIDVITLLYDGAKYLGLIAKNFGTP